MAEQLFNVTVPAKIVTRADGSPFYEGGGHKWYGLSLDDVVRLEAMDHAQNGELLKWAQESAKGK